MGDPFEMARLRDQRILAAIAALDAHGASRGELPDDQPIFVCSVGWRSGSTLLQRLLMTDPQVLVWGEPMDRIAVLDRLVDLVSGIGPDWPAPDHYYSRRGPVDLTRHWVANLAPDPADFRAGLRGLLDGWLAAPARRRGFARWGVKEVRWSGDQARLLKWLYPDARFVLLVRHPVLAYLSVREWALSGGGDGLWIRLPDRHVGDLETFARFRNALAVSWTAAATDLSAVVIRYEDMVAGRVDFAAVGASLGLSLAPETALRARVGGSSAGMAISPEERDRVNALTAAGRRLFGYGE